MANKFFTFDNPVLAGATVRSDKYNTDFQAVETAFDRIGQVDTNAIILPSTFNGNNVIPPMTVEDKLVYIDKNGDLTLYDARELPLVSERAAEIKTYYDAILNLDMGDLSAIERRVADSEASILQSTADIADNELSITTLQQTVANLPITDNITSAQLTAAISSYNSTLTGVNGAIATQIEDVRSVLASDIVDVEAGVTTNAQSIASESQARATLSTNLSASISAESAARDAAIIMLSSALAGETSSRAALETSLTALIDDETSAREAAVVTLNEAIADESTARATLSTTLTAAITSEETDREAAITTVTQAVVTETNARTAQFDLLDARITGTGGDPQPAIDSSIATYNATLVGTNGVISQIAEGLDDAIATTIATLDGRVDDAFQGIIDEAQARSIALTTLDSTLRTALDPTSEINAAITSYNTTLVGPSGAIASQVDSLESSLRSDLADSADITAAINTYNTTLVSASGPISTRVQALETELRSDLVADSVYLSGIQGLANSIANEASARATSLTTLESRLRTDLSDASDISAAISTYNDTLVGPTGAIATQIDTVEASIRSDMVETADVTAAISAYNTSLVAPSSAISQRITNVSAEVTTERNSRTAAINSVNQSIVNEGITRSQAITALNAAIQTDLTDVSALIEDNADAVATESQARATLNTTLRGLITTETGAREAAVTIVSQAVAAEASTRANAITALNTAIRTDLGTDISAASTLAQSASTTAQGAAQSAISLDSRVDDVEDFATAQVGVNTGLNTLTGELEARAFLRTSTIEGGDQIVTGIDVDGVQRSIRFKGDTLTFADTSGVTQLFYANGRWNFAGDISAATGEFGGVMTGRLESPQINMIGTTHMKVELMTGFGSEGLWYWFGPRILLGDGQPNFAALTKANALEWKDVSGNSYFGGGLSAGVLKNAAQSTSKTLNPSVEIGPFSTNGASKQVNVAMSWRGFTSNNTQATPGVVSKAAGTLTLQRKLGSGSWTNLTSVSMTTTNTTFSMNEGGGFWITSITEDGGDGGVFTFTDTNASTSDFSYRVVVSSQSRYFSDANITFQNLSLISVEA
jgi:hypothetical protein